MADALLQKIVHSIKANGPIAFDTFMAMALYDQQYGYYCQPKIRLGKDGDFATAPIFSDLFANCLANQISQLCQSLGWKAYSIVEVGPGDGTLAHALLSRLASFQYPEQYQCVEISPHLRKVQSEKLQSFSKHTQLSWPYPLPSTKENVIVIANELLDAFPVNRFEYTEDGPAELFIDINQDKLVDVTQPASPSLIEHLDWVTERFDTYPFSIGYRSEVNFEIDRWLKGIASAITNGVLFVIDYGYPAHEYYHPDRTMGTLLCHYKHQSFTDPLVRIAEQDITAHVDFTYTVRCALKHNFELLGFTTQSAFLLGNGLLEANNGQNDQVQLLTHPNLMGEAFKVLALGINASPQLDGFSILDHAHRLGKI